MQPAPLPENEEDRLEKLRRYQILDTSPEESFDRITRIVGEIIGVPIALVSLVDKDRQWFKSRYGLDASETPRDLAFCAHAILGDGLFVVEDASKDPRFADNPLVANDPSIRFYAGAPLITPDGLNLGTLCAIDREPHQLTKQQSQVLVDLSHVVVDEMELRIALRKSLDETAQEVSLRTQKDAFISMVSHELRTPLTSIRGSLGLLEGGAMNDKPEEAIKLVSMANRNVINLLHLIDDLLDFQQIVMGKMELEFEVLDVGSLVREACENMAGYAHESGVNILINDETTVPIVGDATRLSQVLANLISNAIKFSCRNDDVVVSIYVDDGGVCIEVKDNGAGIPEDFKDRVFEHFSRAPGQHKTKGSGLGLAISKAIVESHRGRIEFESTAGSGTTFQVKLPLRQTVLGDLAVQP